MGPARHVPDVPHEAKRASIACRSMAPRHFAFVPASRVINATGCLGPTVELIVRLFCRAPTLSYTKQLESRVAQLEDALTKLRATQSSSEAAELRKGSSPASTAASASPSVPYRIAEEDEGSEQDLAQDFEGLKVENDGRISFHGPTSLFQLPGGMLPESSSTAHLAGEIGARKERLINNAWRERAFEQLAAMPEPFQYLLDSHWCWIQPLFNFVYRPAFTRSSSLYTPYILCLSGDH